MAQYYSSELVAYIRQVLQIIPISMFGILDDIAAMQTSHLRELPTKVEIDTVKEMAQLQERHVRVCSCARIMPTTLLGRSLVSFSADFMFAVKRKSPSFCKMECTPTIRTACSPRQEMISARVHRNWPRALTVSQSSRRESLPWTLPCWASSRHVHPSLLVAACLF